MIDFKGSKWYKCDLHLHTTASECFADREVTPEQWVDRAIEQGLHCVAVTDHNTPLGIKAIQEAAKDKPLTIFPGVEITCDPSKVHLLILFDPTKGEDEIKSFLSKCDIEHTHYGKQDATTIKSVFEVSDIATNKCNALVIPAHIDEFSGLYSLSHQNLELFFDRPDINAVQVVHKAFYDNNVPANFHSQLVQYYGNTKSTIDEVAWKKPVDLAKAKNISILTFSDNPHKAGDSKHGLWGIGSRFTWIKMDETPSLEGLRQAFLLPEHRVINDFDIKETDPNKQPDIWFKSLKVTGTNLTTKQDLEIAFNPQLNTIIGGRGSGKSSILRFIRGVFNRTVNLADFEDLLKEQNLFYKKAETSHKKETIGVFNPDTSVVEIEIVRKEVLYKITASKINSASSQLIEVYKWLESSWNEVKDDDKDILEIFEFELYSQKQIYEIAKNPNALRERIDNAIPSMQVYFDKRNRIKNEFLGARTNFRTKQASISNKTKIKTDLEDINNTLKAIDKSGITSTIKSKDLFIEDNRPLTKFIENLDALKLALDNVKIDFSLDEIVTENIQPEYRTEIEGLITASSSLVEVQEKELDKIIGTVAGIKASFEDSIQKSDWQKALNILNQEIENKKKSLSETEIASLTQYEELSSQVATKQKELQVINDTESEMKEIHNKCDLLLKDYISVCKEITVTRSTFINNNIKDPYLKIEIKGFRNRDDFENQLRSIISNESSFGDDIEKLKTLCFTGVVEDKIQIAKKALLDAHYSDTSSEHFQGFFKNALKKLSPSQIDNIEIFMPEDDIIVKYKPEGSSVFKPLSTASAGQKTAAILTFLLSFGDEPLLLDQPEDDLDNRLVYDLVVKGLKKAKEKRQIIVVTHNANIPVNGDAEYILSMDSTTTDIKVLHSGTVENSAIKKEICDVMEGSEKAFQLRSERYKTIFS
ncbi:TrlF family AAA-like ATPase [Polaribacter sp.]|uniref:TrlF family AAA-like ATPase n=3 Tax=Flavobacteriaceae TaxID=49546 RepID=UPI00404717F2